MISRHVSTSKPSPRSPPQPHLSRSVREQLQNAKADAIPSALQPPFQFRDRRHTALMVLHQLAVQICEGRERYPVAGAGAAPATAGAGGAAQGTVQDGRWSLRAAHLLVRAWTVVGVGGACGRGGEDVIPKPLTETTSGRASRHSIAIAPLLACSCFPACHKVAYRLISDDRNDGLSVALDAAVCCGGTSAIATSPRSGATLWRRRQHGVFSKTASDDRVPFAAQTWTIDRHHNPATTNCRWPISKIHGAGHYAIALLPDGDIIGRRRRRGGRGHCNK